MLFNVPQDKINRGIWWSHGCTVIEGCTPVSEGCDNCWAAAMAHQYKRDFSKVTVHLDRLERVVKGKPGKVISLWNDWCHEQISVNQHNRLLQIIDENPQHIFLGLTKRPAFILPHIDPAGAPRLPFPSKLWIGVTAENQYQYDHREPRLISWGSSNLFLSLEPLFEQIDLVFDLYSKTDSPNPISWVVVGCETGPNRRPCDPEWIRSVVRQCYCAEVACFVKAVNIDGKVLKDWDKPAFPDDLKVRDFPSCTAFEVDE